MRACLFAVAGGPARSSSRETDDARTRFGDRARPRGTSRIALTFDAGAASDCFQDLITALDTACVKACWDCQVVRPIIILSLLAISDFYGNTPHCQSIAIG